MVTLVAAGCGGGGGDAPNVVRQCGGGSGLQIRGTVHMPDGRLAHAGVWERLASAVWAPAAAITGAVQPVGRGVEVSLVELRPEDPHGDPGPIAVVITNDEGQYCIGLPRGTDQNVCRYVLQVGTRDDGTLTRAFVFTNDDPIDVDFRSEATVRIVLAEIPPAGLCDFSPAELQTIYDAVDAAPGVAVGDTIEEVNAAAASVAAVDAGVQAAVDAAIAGLLPTVTPTATELPTTRRTETATVRPTRTPVGG